MGLRVGPAPPVGQPADGLREAGTADDRQRVGVRQRGDLAPVRPGARVARDAWVTVIHGLAAAKAERPGLEWIAPVVRDRRVVLGIVMGVRVLVVQVVPGPRDRRVVLGIVMGGPVLVHGPKVDSRIARALKVVHRRVVLRSAPVAVTDRRPSLGLLQVARVRVPRHRAEYAPTVREPRLAASGSRAGQVLPRARMAIGESREAGRARKQSGGARAQCRGRRDPLLRCSGSVRSTSPMNHVGVVVPVNRHGSTPDGSARRNSPRHPHPGPQRPPVSRHRGRLCEHETNASCLNM